MKRNSIYVIITSFLLLFCSSLFAQTSLKKTNEKWELLVDGEPFAIKGVTFGYATDFDNYDSYFKDLNFLGVNTIRLWGTNEHTSELLDMAQKHNIKVMVGIWMRHGRPGMEDDDHFNYLEDKEGMEVMYEHAINTVESYKNHPAVLTWGVGNEVYLNMATDAEKEAYSILLERICSSIKIIDSNHPITSVEAWTFGLDWWQKFVPSLDIYGLNSYGVGAHYLADELKKRQIDKPYIVTEFGVTGEWDIKAENNGIKIEPSDQDKYDAITIGYKEWISNKPNCLGVYVFHYASGDAFLSPWLFTHHRGMYRPQYWAIREAYTGQKPLNTVPKIITFTLPDSEIKSDTWVPVNLETMDIENDSLDISFYYNQRMGSRKRRDQLTPLLSRGDLTNGFEIELPKEHGAIKVYINVSDSYNNVGIASTSIQVIDEDAKNRKYQVPKVRLPFYVYQDGEDLPYAPSAYMGNYSAITVDLYNKEDVHSGHSSIKISYNATDNWYGLGFVDPANDWGDIIGGYDLSGAKTFSFWGKSSDIDIKASIGFGLIDTDKAYPDTGKISEDIVLTKNWKQYTIKIKKLDLSCIRTGFVLFSSSQGFSHSIYIDDIVFE